MKFTVQDHIVVVTDLPAEDSELTQEFLDHKSEWENSHIVLEIGDCGLTTEDIYRAIASILAEQKKAKKSFVLVDEPERLKQYPEDLSAAPTQDEAFDLIEMEEIERDLGF